MWQRRVIADRRGQTHRLFNERYSWMKKGLAVLISVPAAREMSGCAGWWPSGTTRSKHIFHARLIKPPQNKWRPISASEARPINKATWIDALHYLVCGSSLNKCLKYRIAQSCCWWNSVLERVQTYSLSLRRDYTPAEKNNRTLPKAQ